MSATEEILERLASALGVSNQKELAQRMGVTQPTVSSWVKRGTVPTKHLMRIAEENGLSLDHLLLGRGAAKFSGSAIDLKLFDELVRECSRPEIALEEFSEMSCADCAGLMATIYNYAELLLRHKMPPKEVVKAAPLLTMQLWLKPIAEADPGFERARNLTVSREESDQAKQRLSELSTILDNEVGSVYLSLKRNPKGAIKPNRVEVVTKRDDGEKS